MKANEVLKGIVTCISVDGKVGHSVPRKITATQLDNLNYYGHDSGDTYYVTYTGSKVKVIGWMDVYQQAVFHQRQVKEVVRRRNDPTNRIHISGDLHVNPFTNLKLAA